MIHPDTELRFKNPSVGYGVFATRTIPKGTVVWTLCELDRRLSPAQRATFSTPCRDLIDRYAYVDASGDFILCWDHGRYVNHSCEPAMLGVGAEIEMAVRDLSVGDELTCEYGTLNLLMPLACACGAANCRGSIGGSDVLSLASELDRSVVDAMQQSRHVNQPLWPFMRNILTFMAWQEGVQPIPSSRKHHYARP